jgi:hypothetical protein
VIFLTYLNQSQVCSFENNHRLEFSRNEIDITPTGTNAKITFVLSKAQAMLTETIIGDTLRDSFLPKVVIRLCANIILTREAGNL